MRIASLDFLGVNVTPKTNWSFLLVRTECGRTGTGECTLANQEPLLAAEGAGSATLARIDVQAQRHDDERYQLDFAVRIGRKSSEGSEAPASAQVPSAMLVRPNELRLCATSRGDRALFALLRLKR